MENLLTRNQLLRYLQEVVKLKSLKAFKLQKVCYLQLDSLQFYFKKILENCHTCTTFPKFIKKFFRKYPLICLVQLTDSLDDKRTEKLIVAENKAPRRIVEFAVALFQSR